MIGTAHIRMSADLLDDRVIEMPRITQEPASDIVRMLDPLEDIVCQRELGTLPQLGSDVLALEVNVLHPAVMVLSRARSDVLLEDDDVGIGNGLRIGGRKERSSTFMDRLGAEGWRR